MTTFLTRAALAARASLRARRTAGELARLSDAQLKDIGLTRFDIGRVAWLVSEPPGR